MTTGAFMQSRASTSATRRPSDETCVQDLGYRSDLDGLRGLAVAIVVLYHVEWAGFSGGYIGVDLFFVLSGYLISRLIERDVIANRFDLREFYGRRIRRLFPALAATIAISFVVAVAIDPAPQLETFAKEGISALVSTSNFVFWQQSGYFASDAYSKPLLHTWSLGIEEQFYLFWPAVWVFLLQFRSGRWAGASAFGIAAAGWWVAEIWLKTDPAAAFFLLPARIGEFMLGAMLVLVDRVPPVRPSIREGSTIAGFGLIAFSVWTFDDFTRFPGFSALAPCLGAALIIAFGSGPLARSLLCHRAVVALGRISYSLYLVHWPLFVFYRSWTLAPFSYPEKVLLLAFSIFLAALLHRVVEARFRVGHGATASTGSGRFAPALLISTLCLLAVLAHVQKTEGWKWRYPASAIEMGDVAIPASERVTWAVLREVEGRPFSKVPDVRRILVIGDSQAGDFINLLLASGEVQREELSSIVVKAECGSVFVSAEHRDEFFRQNRRVQRLRNAKEQIQSCLAQWDRLFSDERIAQATQVYVANLWYDYHLPYLAATARKFKSISDAELKFVGNKSLAKDPTDYLAACFRPLWLMGSHCGSRADVNRQASELLSADEVELAAKMASTLDALGVGFLDLFELVCPASTGCRLLSEAGRPVYLDRFHTTRTGNLELARGLARLERASGTSPDLLEAALHGPR